MGAFFYLAFAISCTLITGGSISARLMDFNTFAIPLAGAAGRGRTETHTDLTGQCDIMQGVDKLSTYTQAFELYTGYTPAPHY